MSKQERKWRRIYFWLMIFIYCIYGPVEILEYVLDDGNFPLSFIFVGLAIPFIRKNHLNKFNE
ncbi:hypothetical protein M3685_25190 [Heyndrickxia oleronia]|uniref:Uncharacterized protein n=1 Tax=Heyndrickxia oleronia TaxID=38875 RepID=A0A8E2I9K9_9BACI|nr:hypothetical protein [Heyndrickxia oleronia]NYV68443.1 hypothetical protein [Bacillus sp. Gen3]OJH19685.1 hypothetical protein BLX88_06510 [Bacillus obstructivus]MBU5214813.1 hypothetical protein [Heyndrickxia oleronia]MCM3457177.1 hypothetical protein [Heyndrickxia oleronia]MEC1377279.1 hypothetical protein [Heyndrickxia oleronia]